MKSLSHVLVAGLLALFAFAAEAKDQMLPAEATTAPPDQALVVFMRPSAYGGLIKASVYDVTADKTTFIGIIKPKQAIGYLVPPGEHRFMVMAENGDFMEAQLEAGKTYYALVSPRMGMWKARFSLLPVHRDAAAKYSTESEDFGKWRGDARWVKRGPIADAWFDEHRGDIEKKQAKYLEKWNARPASEKTELVLLPADGA